VSRGANAGFALIEVLIVVVIMAILAAAVIPRMSTSQTDANEALIRDHLRTIRMAIELYKAQHGGAPPPTKNHLTTATDTAGNLSPTGPPDGTHPLGPYIKAYPQQPFSGSSNIRLISHAMVNPTLAPPPGLGWAYQATTGRFWVDHSTYASW
jgi:prepilin-type N-terminal cleavage/methylation domain-containing protein